MNPERFKSTPPSSGSHFSETPNDTPSLGQPKLWEIQKYTPLVRQGI